jgi:5-oxoprolinase (ATP-hydrolysing)
MYEFFIDRGGTFTDIIATVEGRQIVKKLLSENPDRYADAALAGIREIIGIDRDAPIPTELIKTVKMGTTVATNALLERKGEPVVLAITTGFKDALRIGYQNRPDIFARQIILPEMLYDRAIEINERYDANGNELIPIDPAAVAADLEGIYREGIRSCAIVLMHSYRYPHHELMVAEIARKIGFTQISISHQVSPAIKLVSRGDTTVVDAYLTPILRRYIDRVAAALPQVELMFMKSDGGLVNADRFQGKDSLLSGPAGGLIGAVRTSLAAGFDRIVTLDIGGTSTDVAHYGGEYERRLETEIAGVRMRTPMLDIHTIAAGGGSILSFDGARYRVGPESAGSYPGPACYGRGGELTITDANVLLGKIQPAYFPALFGPTGDCSIDVNIVREKFDELALASDRSPAAVAAGFIQITVADMANAIAKISLQRGYDLTEYTLCCFGGAGGQMACAIAETLGINTIFIHPLAGVLSAYGMGLAQMSAMRETNIDRPLTEESLIDLNLAFDRIITLASAELNHHDCQIKKLYLKYLGTDTTLTIDWQPDLATIYALFEREYRSRYGFCQPGKQIIIASISIELIASNAISPSPKPTRTRSIDTPPPIAEIGSMFAGDRYLPTPIYHRHELQPLDRINGPAIIIESIGTIAIEPNWSAILTDDNNLILTVETSTGS